MSAVFDRTSDLRHFCNEMSALARREGVGHALEAIAQFVLEVISRDSSWANVFSSPELDAICQELGRLPSSTPIAPIDQQRSVFLVTGIYGVGGHTRVLMDLAHADPGTRKTVLLSNVRHKLTLGEAREILNNLDPSVEVEIAPESCMTATLTWLQARLTALRPARSYILQHQYDTAIVAAVQPELTGRLFYYHNCDHNLTLGVHLKHATHVDFNGKGFHHCRSVEGVAGGVLWPLVAKVNSHRANLSFMESGHAITATSGGVPKFDNSYQIEKIPYRYEYKNVLPTIMRATGGKHIHIGPLSEELLTSIHHNLAAGGVNPENFLHIPFADDVAAELVRNRVDLYVGSFPLGGGRAAVEVMGAGIPLILHSNYVSVFYTDIGEVYPGVMQWRDQDDLTIILAGLTAETLTEHAQRARQFYEGRFTLENLKQAVEATLAGNPPQPHLAPVHFPNALQRYIDLRTVTRRYATTAETAAAEAIAAHATAAEAIAVAHATAAEAIAAVNAKATEAVEAANARADQAVEAANLIKLQAHRPYPTLVLAINGAQAIRTKYIPMILAQRLMAITKRCLIGKRP